MFLFFSVARSQEIGSWERANDLAHDVAVKPVKSGKHGSSSFGMNMPLMSSAFDTSAWLAAA
jgi:hypothetical protein